MFPVKPEHSKLARSILEPIDNYLKENLDTLMCNDVYEMYCALFNVMKDDFRGNFSGFNGYSEFLIFRFLFHLLGGDFKPERWKNTGVKIFKNSQNLFIGQSVKQADFHPDISIIRDEKIIAAAEIKTWLSGGWTSAEDDFNRLRQLNEQNKGIFKGCLIVFSCAKTHVNELTKKQDENHWFHFLILGGQNGCQYRFKDAIASALGLEPFISKYKNVLTEN